MSYLKMILLGLLAFGGSGLMATQSPPLLRVGIITQAYPYSDINAAGEPCGFAIELWNKIAANEGLQTDYRSAGPSLEEGLKGLQANHYDVLVGPVRVVAPLPGVQFSRGYYLNRDTVVRNPTPVGPWKKFFLYCPPFLIKTLWTFLFVLLTLPFVVMVMERRYTTHHALSYGEALLSFIQMSRLLSPYRWYASFATTSLYVMWVVCSLYIGFAVAAIVYGSYVLGNVYKDTLSVRTLQEKRFFYDANLLGMAHRQQLETNLGITLIPMASLEDALEAILQKQVDGIFGNAPLIETTLLRYPQASSLRSSGVTLSSNMFVFAFRQDCPYFQTFNASLEILRQSEQSLPMCQKILGPRYFTSCSI